MMNDGNSDENSWLHKIVDRRTRDEQRGRERERENVYKKRA
jgi:DNA-directed RNA polymerase specialized sigma24 family protein